jgi:hypothetical protein
VKLCSFSCGSCSFPRAFLVKVKIKFSSPVSMIGAQPLSISIRFLFVICTSLPNLFVQIVRRKGYFSEPSMPFPNHCSQGSSLLHTIASHKSAIAASYPVQNFLPSTPHSHALPTIATPSCFPTFPRLLQSDYDLLVNQERKTIAISTPSILIENLNWVHSSVRRYSHIPEQPPPKSNLTPHQQ